MLNNFTKKIIITTIAVSVLTGGYYTTKASLVYAFEFQLGNQVSKSLSSGYARVGDVIIYGTLNVVDNILNGTKEVSNNIISFGSRAPKLVEESLSKLNPKNISLAVVTGASNNEKNILADTAVFVYRTINGLFVRKDGTLLEVTVVSDNLPLTGQAEEKPSLETTVTNGDLSLMGQATTIINPVREVIRETKTIIERVVSGVTLADLQALNNELKDEIYRTNNNTQSNQNRTVNTNYAALALSNRIDKLRNTEIITPTITGGSISSSALSGVTITGSTFAGSTGIFTGNVGIGTTTPTEKLSINGAVYLAPITSPAVTTDRLYNISNDLYWGGNLIAGSAVGSWTSNGTNVWRVGGNVGIGTSSPEAKLHINGEMILDDNNSNLIIKGKLADITVSGTENTIINLWANGANTMSGGQNTALGAGALNSNTSGYRNTAIGTYALVANTTGLQNVAIGYQNMSVNLTGGNNVSIGIKTLQNHTGGHNNVALGSFAGQNNLTGAGNIFLGYTAGQLETGSNKLYIENSNSTSPLIYGEFDNNIVNINGSLGIGTTSPYAKLAVVGSSDESQLIIKANSTQSNSNPLIKLEDSTGAELLRLHSDDSTNVFLGLNTGRVNNSSGDGIENTFIGSESGYSNYDGDRNTGIGFQTLYSNTDGYGLSAIGYRSLYANTTGNYNTAYGNYSMYNNTTGDYNTALGYRALYANTTGDYNSAMGNRSLYSNTTGIYNTANGNNSLYTNTTGNYNTALGYISGRYIADGSTANTTGDYNTFLGYNTKALADNDQNEIVIGYDATGVGSNSVVLGNDSITTTVLKGNVGVGTDSPEGKLHIFTEEQTTPNAAADDLVVEGSTTAGISILGRDLTNSYLMFGSPSNNFGAYLRWGYNNGLLSLATNKTGAEIRFASDTDDEAMRIDSNGNVGIGTTSPNTKLNVYQSSITDGIQVNGYGANIGSYLKTYVDASNYSRVESSGALRFVSGGSGTISFLTNGLQRVSISNAGALGLNGTNSFLINSDQVDYGARINLGTSLATKKGLVIRGYTSQTADLTQWQDSSGTVLNVVDANGNVGIGTVSPSYKLDVNGFINTDGTTGGYKIDGNTILQASSTNFSTLVGDGAGNSLLSDGSYNTALGYQALYTATSSDNNTAVGYKSLYFNTTGNYNTANGYNSLYSNTTGYRNTANGYQSLYNNTTGYRNTANGYQSLYNNTTGYRNTANGYQSLYSNTTGYQNTANGVYSLELNTTGSYNSALGYASLSENTEGNYNTATGFYSLKANSTGDNNTSQGYQSLYSNTTGYRNTAQGVDSFYGNITGYENVAIGYKAGQYVVTGESVLNTTGDRNVFLGANTEPLADNDQNEIVIGYNATGIGSNSVTLGNDSITTTALKGNVGIGTTSPFAKLSVENGTASTIGQIIKGAVSQSANLTEWQNSAGTSDTVIDSSGAINLPNTTFANQIGIVKKNGTRFIHNFNYGNNGTVTTAGYNTFIGENAGNLTMGSTATSASHASYNTAVGSQSLSSNTTGNSNTANGNYSLFSNTTGEGNIATGYRSLQTNTTGDYNVAIGADALFLSNADQNTAVGYKTLYYNTSGSGNVGLGYSSLFDNTTGSSNVGVGQQALANNTTGGNNISLGAYSLWYTQTGSGNVAIGRDSGRGVLNQSFSGNSLYGYKTGYSLTTGNNNSFIGYESGYGNQDGTGNTALGYQSLYTSTTTDYLTAVGYQAGYSNTTGIRTVAVGYASLSSNTTGSGNTAVGTESLKTNSTGASNTAVGSLALKISTASNNSSFGASSLQYNTTGSSNTAIGSLSMQNNTTGKNNSVVGSGALKFNTTGNYNIAIGDASLYLNTTGSNNVSLGYYANVYNQSATSTVAIGAFAGQGVSGQSYNQNGVLLGYRAGFGLTTGDNNLLLGYSAGDNLTTGDSNIVIGYNIDSPTATNSNTMTIGNLIYGTGIDGTGTTVSSGNVGIGTTSPQSKLDIYQGNLNLDNTTNANQYGVISKNGTRFIHNFNYGDNGTVTTVGYNTFIGENAGNLTMGSTATSATHASYNTAVGYQSLYANTTGSQNSAQGSYSLRYNTTGNSNTAQGYASLRSNTTGIRNTANGYYSLFSNTTGNYNSAQGYLSLYLNTTGHSNSAQGVYSLYANTTGYSNSAQGSYSLFSNTTGSYNTAFGYFAGRYITDGATANETSSNSLYLGYNTKALADGDTNEIVIGYDAVGVGSNSVVLGNDLITKTVLKGNVGVGTTSPFAKLSVTGSGTGTGLAFQVADSTNSPKFTILDNGNVGIGVTNPTYDLMIGDSDTGIDWESDGVLSFKRNNVEIFRLDGDVTGQGFQFNTTYALNRNPCDGSSEVLETTADGTLRCGVEDSDERLKNVIARSILYGLDDVVNMELIQFQWNELSGHSQDENSVDIYQGFSGQNLASSTPQLVFTGADGYYAIDQNGLIATAWNAIRELNLKVEDLASSTPEITDSFSIIDSIMNYLETLGVRISEGIARFKKLVVDDEICIGNTCINEEQLILLIEGGIVADSSEPANSPEPIADSSPVITIIGNNPATVELNGTYSDLGATATNNNGELSVSASVFASSGEAIQENININEINLDTSTSTTYTITYTATDTAGNTATTTREVIIGSGGLSSGSATDGGDTSGDTSTTTPSVIDPPATTTPPVLDTTAPTITLTGSETIEITVGDTYTDQGATANDETDGDITPNIITLNPVDTNTAGTYTVTYNITDTAGNIAIEVTRTVIVLEPIVIETTTATSTATTTETVI